MTRPAETMLASVGVQWLDVNIYWLLMILYIVLNGIGFFLNTCLSEEDILISLFWRSRFTSQVNYINKKSSQQPDFKDFSAIKRRFKDIIAFALLPKFCLTFGELNLVS